MGTAQAAVAGVQADVRGTLAAVHFRRAWLCHSLTRAVGRLARPRLGYLPPTIALRADVRIAGTCTQPLELGGATPIGAAQAATCQRDLNLILLSMC